MRSFVLLAAMIAATPLLAQQPIDPKVKARIDRILEKTPLIDGHNDLAWELRDNHGRRVEGLASGTASREKPLMTDMTRLKAGRVGGQFWSVYIPATFSGDAAIRATLEQIDIAKRVIAAYPETLAAARTADDIVRIHKSGRVASLMGMEGGHSIGGSLAALRDFHELGVGYMTLTHSKNNELADSATDDPKHNGLTDFGRVVVWEMNRIGMLVDLSHVSPKVMTDVLAMTRAPVIFSHSDARAISNHPRNVPDEVLRLLPANGGVVMVNFYTGHLSEAFRQWSAAKAGEQARLDSALIGQPVAREAAMKAWIGAHPQPVAEVGLVADHIEHVAKVAGHDHVGIGGDLDGIDVAPTGLGSVDSYPLVFAELIRRGWSDENLAKFAGGNVLRVMRRAEAVSASMKNVPPALDKLP